VDGSELARLFFTFAGRSVQPCVRPVRAVHMTAGHNAFRGSGPGQKPAFEMHWHKWVVLIAGSTGSALRLLALPTFTSRREYEGFPVAITSGHQGPRHSRDLVGERVGRRANNDASALCWTGFAFAYVLRDLDAGTHLIDRALALNPNLADAWYLSGWVRGWLGEPAVALQHIAHAMRLSPLDPRIGSHRAATATAHFVAGRYDGAASWSEKALRDDPGYGPAARLAAVSHALAGRPEQAQKAMERVFQVDPALRMSNAKDRIPPFRPDDLARYEGRDCRSKSGTGQRSASPCRWHCRPRRRGDQIRVLFAAVHESAFGTKQTYRGEFALVRFRSEADKPRASGAPRSDENDPKRT
jgi:hypothetical protein